MSKIQTNMVIEILGRPPEHITEAINGIVEKINKEKGVKVTEKICHEPIQVEGSKDLFTTFADIMVELDSLEDYFRVMFTYMPSHIELISPEKITLVNSDLNTLGNKLMQRLHEYDAITKKVILEHDLALKKLQEVAPEMVSEVNPQQAPVLPSKPEQFPEEQKEKKPRKSKKKQIMNN